MCVNVSHPPVKTLKCASQISVALALVQQKHNWHLLDAHTSGTDHCPSVDILQKSILPDGPGTTFMP